MRPPRPAVKRARRLRKILTLPEGLLWRILRPRDFDGPRIRRQHPEGPYVLDFYCEDARLCIEVDGQSHGFGDQPCRDEIRDQYLAVRGIRTLRLSAQLVLSDIDSA